MSISENLFKQCLGSFASGVTVMTTLQADGKPHGVTISAFASLSLQPPLILFNLDKDSKSHDIFAHSTDFIVNILSEAQQTLSEDFSTPLTSHLWNQVSYHLSDNRIPILDNIVAHLTCHIMNRIDGGDHTIIIGQVLKGASDPSKKPLLHYRGAYYPLGQL